MAWEARSGWKRRYLVHWKISFNRLNGLGSPFGMETVLVLYASRHFGLAKWPGKPVRDGNRLWITLNKTTFRGLNGLGSPFGMETTDFFPLSAVIATG